MELFTLVFNGIYDALYNSEYDELELAERHDYLMEHDSAYKSKAIAFVKYRQDYISSNRESAAFYLAHFIPLI